ncbi:hypothetical protein SAMD00019534_010600 [Acytostelium subglobosum LB1]|uniref:hypothetical protein n=1 Tax=Acytostelium subglobosum LB1 TaxID=1410327 RepID=UPI0006449F76|nr:hypothetical protein SAMD00019534_010600 [Acytostelium subglobosum LB1]GAM17885.1 hypothetical protein SAMD00019534_010600 [Acytostelium subglobosum LB1]|eukprot:XP_012758481.1 hypothetical protein SAMD00019534_010600 [Acytostelium subglobosum LB1]
MKLLIVLLIILSLLSLPTTFGQEQQLGDAEVGDTISVKSKKVETLYKFQVDGTLVDKPKISFSLSRGSAQYKDIIRQDDGTNNFTIDDLLTLSSANKLAGQFSFVTLLCLMVSFTFTSNQSTPSRMLSTMLVLTALSTFVLAINLDELTVVVTIRVPTGYVFKSINLDTGKGSLDMSGLQATTIKVNACNGFDFPISFNGLSVTNLDLCSQSPVVLANFQTTTNANVKVTTPETVNVQFMTGYHGSLSITTAKDVKPLINGTCTMTETPSDTTLVTAGSCGSASSSINLRGDKGVSFIAVETCPLDSTWRDAAPAADGPASPAFSTMSPAYVINMPSYNDWHYNNWLGALVSYVQTPAGAMLGSIDVGNALSVTQVKWQSSDFVMMSMNRDFYLRKGYSYKIEVDLLTSVADLKVYNLSVCTFPFYNVSRDKVYFEDGVVEAGECQAFTQTGTNLATNTAWTSVSMTFVPTKEAPVTPIGLRLKSKPPGFNSTVYFRNMRFTAMPAAVVQPTLLSKDSMLVTLPKATSGLTPQDRSTCPHLQSGLVHWHDPATWGGVIPSPSSIITLPENTKVLISSCSIVRGVVYQKIVIPATSQLIFSDSSYSMSIHDIDVRGQLLMGSSACRMNGNIELVFSGSYTAGDTISPRMGSKGIAVAKGGYISVQGKQYYKTWSRLAASAYAFESTIYLQDNVNWEPGQQVFITTSKYQDERSPQNEVRTIRAVSNNIVEFTEPLRFFHYGGQEYQAEVGLLSRRIVFRGDNDSDAAGFGGHVLTMSNGQFAGIQLIKMGQTNLKGRYPLHFHLANYVTNSYISDCSTQQSFYRCYTIHGTHNLLLTQNVAYDTLGHCYYIEDGVEENNTISYNLAAYVHTIGRPANGAANGQIGEYINQTASLTQPADAAAGCYYITNAYNTIIGNAASGGWASYSFPNLQFPVGNYRNRTDIKPESRVTLKFDGNTAHSSGYFFESFGACVYCGGRLYYRDNTTDLLTYISGRQDRDTTDAAGNKLFMQWTNMKVSLCQGGIGHWGNEIEINGYESHDNQISGTVFGSAWLNNAIVNAFSDNPVDQRRDQYYGTTKRQGFQFYDTVTHTVITNINFRNFQHDASASTPEEDNAVIVSMTHSDQFKPQQISATKGITFTNVQMSQRIGHYVRETGSSRYFNFIDWDGSIVGESTPQIVGSSLSWWNFNSACKYNADWKVHYCPLGSNMVGNIEFESPGMTYAGSTNNVLGNSSLFGPNLPAGGQTAIFTSNPGITGILDLGWFLNFDNLVSPSKFTLDIRQIPFGHYILLAIPYPASSTFSGTADYNWLSNKKTLTAATSVAQVLSGTGRLYYFDGSNLFIKLVNPAWTGAPEEAFTRGGVSINDLYWSYTYSVTATCPTSDCKRTNAGVLPTWPTV